MKRRCEYVFDVIAVIDLGENTLELYDEWNGRLERLPAGGMKFKRIVIFHGLGGQEEETAFLRSMLKGGE